jgi:hypothetical protein
MITAKAKSTVKISNEKASAWTCENQYHVTNVNVAQGPRTGNPGTASKRSDFIAAKASREPLATMINDAYVARAHEYKEHEYTNGGSIHDNTQAEFKKRTKSMK